EGNNHRPHLLRSSGTRNIIILILFFELAAFIVPGIMNLNLSGGMAAVLPAVLGELTNEERQAENLSVLSDNPYLTLAAKMKAEDMAAKGYFA
ncbi:CAP domain-containing protein, partial [Mycobacterium tuberculosis]|uniref:CAP domain-containing protein n=1 Tax=Mycobacterium tuberculosis TaxID=1773 RepID=UPI00254DA708